MELFVFFCDTAPWNRVQSHLLFLLFFFAFIDLQSSPPLAAPPSHELDSVPLRLDPTCHQDASLRIRPIQCVRLGAVWFCFLLPGFLRYAPLSPSAHPRTCCFSKCPRVAATNINRGLRLGEGRPRFFYYYYYSVCLLLFCSRFEVLCRSAPAATSCWIPDSHIQPTHPLAFFFFFLLLFVVSGSSINSSR